MKNKNTNEELIFTSDDIAAIYIAISMVIEIADKGSINKNTTLYKDFKNTTLYKDLSELKKRIEKTIKINPININIF